MVVLSCKHVLYIRVYIRVHMGASAGSDILKLVTMSTPDH
jgi:hypothetical protein